MLKKKNIKDFGTVKELTLNLTKPIQSSYNIEMNKLNLMVGKNGVGKSLMLKLVWLLSAFASIKLMSIKDSRIDFNSIIQEFIDKTFDDNDFTGEVKIKAPGGSVKIEIDEGKIVYSLFDIAPSIKEIPFPIYMSSITRTFEQIEKFLRLEKDLGQSKIFDYYKMYDICFCQMIKNKYSQGILMTNKLKESLKDFDLEKHEIESVIFKNDKFYFINKKKEEKALTSLSTGEQSLINMLLVNS